MNELTKTPIKIAVVDDDTSLLNAISLNLKEEGYDVTAYSDSKKAIENIRENKFDFILCDLRMPEIGGIEFIQQCKEIDPILAIILMTGYGSSDVALDAIRAGAYDYLSKPFSTEELVFTLKKVEENTKLRRENQSLKSRIDGIYSFSSIIAQSKQMTDIFETVKRLSDFNTTVLIKGESGTGKELIARAIHHNSPRRDQPFIAINCGAIPDNLVESELFGHKKGAFTDAQRDKKGLFEEANGGSILLDEIGELPLHLQVKLLRALQERQIRRVGGEELIDIDVRLIAATLRDLEDDVKKKRFRDDLFYRLNVVTIEVPPLRERVEDIPVLSEYFLVKHAERLGIDITKIEPEALKYLVKYHWRGNVRELENCIERALVLSESGTISVESLPEHIRNSAHEVTGDLKILSDDNLSVKHHTKQLEILLIKKALAKTKGNRTHAAKLLEISHRALLYKLKEYGLTKVGK